MAKAKIDIRCPGCRQKYSIKAKFENKFVDCVKCSERFQVVAPVEARPTELVEAELVDADLVEAELIEPFIQQDNRKLVTNHLTDIFKSKPVVIDNPLEAGHEIDILIFGPANNRPFYCFSTSGMSSKSMGGSTEITNIEMLVFVQPEFDIASDEAALLYFTMATWANLPFQSGSPFLHGQVLNFDEHTPVHPASEAIHWGLLNPQLISKSFCPLHVGSIQTIHFLWMFPIYIEEFFFKKEAGIHQLEQKLFSELSIQELVRFNRRNVCKKSMMNRFFKR